MRSSNPTARRVRVTIVGALGMTLLVVGLAPAVSAGGPSATPNDEDPPSAETTSTVQPEETIVVDARDGGRTFDGVGGVSAGASSRLLYDYPEPERGQILDYLFTPNYGAAMDLLKVEIGGETNSTAGSEASHMRTPDEVDCNRGYEWWLMEEAVERNPDIELAGLEWGAPGWFEGGFFSQDNIDYIMAWLGCAEQRGLEIDYVGGWNERGYEAAWFIELNEALEQQYPDVQIIGADEIESWAIADDMAADERLAEAIDVVGVHFACGNRSQRRECTSTDTAKDLGHPLWMSEVSALAHDTGAAPAARSINRMYIDAELTGYMTWSPVSAWYANLPIADTGAIVAEWPWSGHYRVGETVWAFAHTTQFTEPGWSYLDTGSGYLDSGASYVSLTSPDESDFSTVIETLDADTTTTAELQITGGLPSEAVQLWSTDLTTDDESEHFVHAETLESQDGSVTVTLKPGHVYTLSTTTGQSKGSGEPEADVYEQLQMPFAEDFEDVEHGDLAPYFSDVNGSFDAVECAGDRNGICYRQQTPQQPISWATAGNMDPTTLVGDPRWWGDYRVSTDFLLEEGGYAELLGRVSNHATPWGTTTIGGYHLRVSSDGTWQLYSADYHQGNHQLASGEAAIGTDSWHSMALRMEGSTIDVVIDDEQVAKVEDERQRTGGVGLAVQGFSHAQFDDVQVSPTSSRHRFVPQAETSANATSELEFDGGYSREAAKAVDGRPETFWRSEPGEPLPQNVTVDLGRQRRTHGIAVQPRFDASSAGMITRYSVSISDDGEDFEQVAEGFWELSGSTKVIAWPERRRESARYVRIEALDDGCASGASVAEVQVAVAPIPGGDFGVEPDRPDFDFIPHEELSATASSAHPGFEPGQAIDGDCATLWHTPFRPDNPPLPQSITIDLGTSHDVAGMVYYPRQDGNANAVITEYTVSVSSDGESFTEVEGGQWDLDSQPKVAEFGTTEQARYIRLTAIGGGAGLASAAEVRIAKASS